MRKRDEAKLLVRCTPVVWTGGPPKVARPPNKSDRLPKAVRLVRALSAPGLANSWASGNAEANELAAAARGFVRGVGVVVVVDDVVDDVLELKTLDVVLIGDDDVVVLVLLLFEILLLNVDVVVFKFVFVVLVVLLLLLLLICPPFVAAVAPLTVVALFASWRFAFCNSTLQKGINREREREKENRILLFSFCFNGDDKVKFVVMVNFSFIIYH